MGWMFIITTKYTPDLWVDLAPGGLCEAGDLRMFLRVDSRRAGLRAGGKRSAGLGVSQALLFTADFEGQESFFACGWLAFFCQDFASSLFARSEEVLPEAFLGSLDDKGY